MNRTKLQLLCILCCGINFQLASTIRVPLGVPYFNDVPLPPETPSPINITSRDAKWVIRTPRFSTVAENSTHSMQNTGNEVFVTPSPTMSSDTIGGVAGLVKYILYGIRFIWNFSLGPAASIVDGVGAPVELIFIYQNLNYDSFQESLLHRDGILIATTRVLVGNKTNTAFADFIPYLNAINTYGSTVDVPASTLAGWFGKPFLPYYHSYAGSYTDFNTKKQYYCATICVEPLYHAPVISYSQFRESFMQLKNQKNVPYDNPVPSFKNTGTPVITTGPEFYSPSPE